MTLSVILVGTSNSTLRNAFAWPFENDPQVSFTNASLGASCSANAAWSIGTYCFANRDFALIDLSNNDEYHVEVGRIDIERVINNYCTLFAACAEHGVVPVVVEFARQAYLQNHPLHDAVMKLCSDLEVATLDTYGMLDRLVQRAPEGTKKEAFFLDAAHLKQSIARLLGREVIAALKDMHSSGPSETIRIEKSYREISYHDMSIIRGARTIERDSSLTALKLAVLEEGKAYSVTLDDRPADAVALHLNSLESTGSLFLDDYLALEPPPERAWEKKWPFLSVTRPIITPFELAGTVRLDVRNEDEGEERTSDPVRFELAGLIMQAKEELRYVRVTRSPLGAIEIGDRLSDETLDELITLAKA